MATSLEPYDKWLEEKLLSLNPDIDTDVFVMYIKGILDEDAPDDEKKESLQDLLGGMLECDQELVCEEITKKWSEISSQNTSQNSNDGTTATLATQFADLLQTQNIESVKTHQKSDEEKARKAAILAQYANVSDEEDVSQPSDPGASKPKTGGGAAPVGPTGGSNDPLDLLAKNMNALSVTQMEKEKREKSKEEAEKKREKDKLDRQAQKQKQQERKDAEKKRTQKGERKTR